MSDDENISASASLKLPKSSREGSRSPSKETALKPSDNLKKQRGVFKARLTSFSKYISKFQDIDLTKSQIIELNLRISQLESVYLEFNKVQTKIEDLIEDGDLLTQIEYREIFEDQYFGCISKAKSILEDNSKDRVMNNDISSNKCQPSSSHFKLPNIQLPTFDGSYDDWLEFKNSYCTMIHKRTDLEAIHKFHYLRSSLSGSALQVISALEFTDVNYAHAWDLLVNRFQNDRLLVHNHIKSLFSIQNINKESPLLIRKLIDTILRNLRALKSLGEPTESWDTLIMYLIVCKLDSSSEREWENHKGTLLSNLKGEDSKRKLRLDDLLTFLRNRADLLDMVDANSSNSNSNSHSNKSHFNSNKSHSYSNKQFQNVKLPAVETHTQSYVAANNTKSVKRNRVCVLCHGNHALYICSMFLNLSLDDRCKLVNEKKLCSNCLRSGHSINDCLFGPCKQCKRKHNSLLHKDSPADFPSSTESSSSQIKSTVLHCTNAPAMRPAMTQPVLLSTALVDVLDDNNKRHTARALLDNGSQHCFVSDAFCKRIKYSKFIQSTIRVLGVGQSVSHSNKLCDLVIQSKVNDYYSNIQCFVLPQITSVIPPVSIDVDSIRLPKNLKLADPPYFLPSEIDLLIGADLFWELLNDNKIKLKSGPYMQDSKLGWLLSGPIYTNKLHKGNKIQCNFTQTIDLQLRKFWELENNISQKNILTSDERKCEQLFSNTTKRELDGRFSVRIPLRESSDSLGDSYTSAYKRFLSLERKLERMPHYKSMYSDFIREYRELGHMSKIDRYSKPHYFLPHHGVYREHSTTTKLRVVFDASCTTSSGKSLNEIQHIGLSLQNDIFGILLRFRQHLAVACADVEKMFRQILIHQDQRNLQLILWREKPSDPIDVYQLNTVTYGTASAPYLSMRCLQQIALECDDEFLSRVIKEDFYVDDLITGHDDPLILIDICEKISHILRQYCYPLRKWTFSGDVTAATSSKELAIGEHTQTKTLGLGWHNKEDYLHFTSELDMTEVSQLSKRKMLSVISQIYDPLGLLAPVVIIAKITLQRLWLCKIDWDDCVPSDVTEKFYKFVDSIQKYLHCIKIPRFVRNIHAKRTELHIFSDASQDAYGACAYIRTVDGNSEVSTNLLCAKSKVAPLKTVSIPKLELCGALIGARLYKKIVDSLTIQFDSVYFWTDSTIVVGWLRMPPHLLKTFVQNRVSEVNELTGDSLWLHVDGHENPADLVSRGLYIDALKNNTLWWHGPTFLQCSNWSNNNQIVPVCKELPELKVKTVSAICTTSESLFDFDKFSSFNRLIRVGAYVLRFIHNIRNRQTQRTGSLSVAELHDSQIVLTRCVQVQSFASIYKNLLNKVPLTKCKDANKILALNVFLDDNKLIRVGGRLCDSSSFNYDKRHPILLCAKHNFTRLLFRHQHRALLHAGPQHLLCTIRESWWPLSGRNLARKTVHECVTCIRMKGKTLTPIMGNLPTERLEASFPFMRTGVDYAGPVYILNRKGRGAKLIKAYICLFICFTTRCIHLELVSGLSTNDYILALKRFISRRGKPAEIFSDNGTNFVGAEKEFPLLLQQNLDKIIDYTANDGIRFHFIPPYAAHFGGYWEAGVKSCKYHLRRIVGNANLTYEEFNTALAQIEAVLNSRPMYSMSTDPSDLLPLTPAHFLIGRPLTAPACADFTEVPSSRLIRYDRVEQLRQHFWKRWSAEYVVELQRRTKWKTSQDNLTLDSLVLLKDDNQPPLKWSLGRIIRTYPGKDGISRVADIRTATGIVRRAFSKICPLLPSTHEANDDISSGSAAKST